MVDVHIINAERRDAKTISNLIYSLRDSIVSPDRPEGLVRFKQHIAPESIAAFILSPDYAYYCGWRNQVLAGVIAIKYDHHLFHLFVAQAFQNQSIATQLWQHAKHIALNNNRSGTFTVNASLYAVNVYKKLGFKMIGNAQEKEGVTIIPMQINGND